MFCFLVADVHRKEENIVASGKFLANIGQQGFH
jgi:hypothetical protein